MPYITECKAPDILDLGETLLSRAISGLVFLEGRKYPESGSSSRLLNAYFIVTDKAVREYNAGRVALIAYSTSANKMALLVEGLGRFETCINSAKRAYRLLEDIKTHPESPAIDRTIHELNENWEKKLTPIRNLVEHIDGEILGLSPGVAHLLAINRDGDHLEIGTEVLALADLAKTMRRLHEAGCALLAALPLATQE